MNRTDMDAAIRDYLNRPNLETATITLWIQSIEGELNRLLREHPRMILRTAYTQEAGNPILPLPVDVMQVITLRRKDTVYRQFPPSMREGAKAAGDAFIAFGDCLEIFPSPSAATEFNLEYAAALKPVASDFDANWVSTYFSDIYIYGALKEAAVYLKDDARLAQWTQEFMRRVDGLLAQGWNQNIATMPNFR